MKLQKLTPNLLMENVNSTIEFYREILGFELVMTVPEKGLFNWAMMKSGNVELMFQARDIEEIPALKGKEKGGSLSFFIEMEDIKGLYEKIKGKATIVKDLYISFYGMEEFVIQDPDGFILIFAQKVNK